MKEIFFFQSNQIGGLSLLTSPITNGPTNPSPSDRSFGIPAKKNVHPNVLLSALTSEGFPDLSSFIQFSSNSADSFATSSRSETAGRSPCSRGRLYPKDTIELHHQKRTREKMLVVSSGVGKPCLSRKSGERLSSLPRGR